MINYNFINNELIDMTKKDNNSIGAEFASKEYLKSEGLLSSEGFILGNLEDGDLITDASNMNVLLLAESGMGKGIACVVPNLLNWKDSVVINDIKAENYNITSGYRKNVLKQDVFLWYPTNTQNTNCFNPLDILNDKDINTISVVQKITKILLPDNDYLDIEARNLLSSIMLYLKDKQNNTFGEIYSILKNSNLNEFINSNIDKEKIRSKALESIKLWQDEVICHSTSKSDFNLKNLNQKATTIYVGISINEIERLRPLLQLFYLECVEYLLSDNFNVNTDIKRSTLMVLDEISSLGKMDFLTSKLSCTRGFKVKTLMLAQNLDEISSTYGKDGLNQILSNCPYKIIFTQNNYKTAEFISKTIGDEILVDKNGVKTKQTLICPEELMNMGKTEEVILTFGAKVIKCNKLMYYKDKKFTERVLKPAKV